MSAPATVDVDQVVETQKVGSFSIRIIVLMGLMMLTEGYDLGALSFAAPAIGRAWGIDRGALGPAFGAFVFGTMLGAFVLGYLGDVIGRKRAILVGSSILAALTLAVVFASDLRTLLVLRLLAGIGIGGVVPNAIAYMTEFAPRRLRATWVTLMYTGYSVGTGLGGVVAAWMIPRFGWQAIFVIGGVGPLLAAVMLALWVPESIRFLALKRRRTHEIARVAAQLHPGKVFNAQMQYVVSSEATGAQHARLRQLLAGRLRRVTPLLWAVYVANSMALFFLVSWLPMLIEAIGVPPARAALVSSAFSVGGTIGGLALMRFVDTRGALIVAVLPLIGCPLVAALGSGIAQSALIAAVFMIGFCVVGAQFGLNAVAAMVYPTALRAKGVGVAVGIQKIGAIAGPVIGGALLSLHWPVSALFYFGAVPVGLVAIFAFALGMLHRHDGGAPPDPAPHRARSA
ncbi:MFS transporter [Pandoraea nosoerga]|uniref:MFS transporter n=1 Tax=Pandoraea nosoerga TaxID=2508296 RepID=A0A5E4U5K4_9BURK|nr:MULTISPECIES: MFS transporter [Pandoraea]MBN4667614.1 MFS transporter [Pandoraea nosoerga]MBN4676733.1 MFS transporter [Pandoraea nosoerga]MBN4683243.1 MFS transporter [Pandoraea nosoerga]MBN4746725.1 MFS transporter [Pandoraea nosoerga]VVD95330.1 MFS transporter [Pandoraea nosoerga]